MPAVTERLEQVFRAQLLRRRQEGYPTLPPHPSGPQRTKTRWEHIDHVLLYIDKYLKSLGFFFEILLTNVPRGDSDPRTTRHRSTLSRWLSGDSVFRPVQLVQAIYQHRYSVPKARSKYSSELDRAFDGNSDLQAIRFARPGLSIWALQLSARRCAMEIGKAAHTSTTTDDAEFQAHLQAAANTRMAGERDLVTEEDLLNFSTERSARVLQARAPAVWYLTEWMAGTRKNGGFVVRPYRPHPLIQTAAISSFVIARNKFANAYWALPMGVFLFASKAQSDVKRIFCRIGLAVADTTVRRALAALTQSREMNMQRETAAALAKKEPAYRINLDNIQKYQIVHEPGLGKKSTMIVGTAATAIRLDDCEPGAFNLDAHEQRIIQNTGAESTIDDLLDTVDFPHLECVHAHHILRILCEFIPQLEHYLPQIAQRLREAPLAKHRMRPGRKTHIVPLRANGHNEMETHGMQATLLDFDTQLGYTSDNVNDANIILLQGGDGGSVLCGTRVARYLFPQAATLSPYQSFEGRIWIPGIFHTSMHSINAIAENHYGDKTSQDPSALAHSAVATDLHVPSNLSQCDYYATTRTMTTIFKAEVLDVWDLFLSGHTGLHLFFDTLAEKNQIPTVDELLEKATVMIQLYMSSAGYYSALARSGTWVNFVQGPTWDNTSPSSSTPSAVQADADFAGDQVLANSIIFRRDFLNWVELSDAVSEGDIGRVVEVLKLWIFMFAGASKQNYVTILLELHFFFKYDASTDLCNAVWNNWVVSLSEELGKALPDDHLQEHQNKVFVAMTPKTSKSFDEPFIRNTISPNVHFFMRIKEEMERTFELSRQSKTHTSRDINNEIRKLTAKYRTQKLHYFCKGRFMGHTAKDLIDEGYKTLDSGKFNEFQQQRKDRAALLKAIRKPEPRQPLQLHRQTQPSRNSRAIVMRRAWSRKQA
ncbi:hypothetical protein GGX14DRAFT_382544 [Mycena pura]|uniref:DUF6589 domain-containing protein n=1 Tax=Mycena pura TaxID=153505 RepID=A0AAD6XZN1_9AGAR|nr:hypothetical protein GGX14DRAFT_382544 [Mycena pura]